MEKRVILDNGILKVEIKSLGAEMTSITDKNGKNRLWCGDASIWGNQAPLLWPICGGLKNDRFEYEGKTYTLPKHGFGKLEEFLCESADNEKAVFLLKPNEKTKAQYPFDYELRVIYELCENTVKVTYSVINLTDGDMYFSVGAHEGYSLDCTVDNYSIIFEKTETLDSWQVDGSFLNNEKKRIIENSNELKLDEKYFKPDALIFKDIKSRRAALRNNVSGEQITVDFTGFDHLLLWKKSDAKYLCIEPWCGMPDSIDSSGKLVEKESIRKIEKNGVFEVTHSIIIE